MSHPTIGGRGLQPFFHFHVWVSSIAGVSYNMWYCWYSDTLILWSWEWAWSKTFMVIPEFINLDEQRLLRKLFRLCQYVWCCFCRKFKLQ
jgi:hypothetical protein